MDLEFNVISTIAFYDDQANTLAFQSNLPPKSIAVFDINYT
jgi:hypothetical protein